MKIRLFVDMDGTLAEWRKASRFEELLEKGYFRSLQPHQNVVDAIRTIIRDHSSIIDVYSLSAYLTESEYALNEKHAWLDEFCPELAPDKRIFVPCNERKTAYIPDGIRSTDILLDDYSFNLHDWAKYAHGVKLLNGINATVGTWCGDCISRFVPADEIVADIMRFAKAL